MTCVDFPIKYLDLTKYMPPPLSTKPDPNLTAKYRRDARTQTPPYVYELCASPACVKFRALFLADARPMFAFLDAVSNHTGSLSSGHCKSSVFNKPLGA